MLEAILFLRCGVVLSSVPRLKLDSPPGGLSTLQRQSGMEGHRVSAPPSALLARLFGQGHMTGAVRINGKDHVFSALHKNKIQNQLCLKRARRAVSGP